MASMISGFCRTRQSLQPAYRSPPKSAAERLCFWTSVPIAPSNTTTFAAIASRYPRSV